MFRTVFIFVLLGMAWGGILVAQTSYAEMRPTQIHIVLDAQSVIRVNGEVVELYQARAAIMLARLQYPDYKINVRVHPDARVKAWLSLDKTLKGMKLSCDGRYVYENGQRMLREVQTCRDWPS